jgi:hypothetical protein
LPHSQEDLDPATACSVELARARRDDDTDPELLALPTPSRRERTFALAVLTTGIAAALAVVLSLGGDVAYALSSERVVDVGDLRTAPDATLGAHVNGFVRGAGLVGAAGGIRYERPFRDDTFRALPIVGRGGPMASTPVWVEVRVPEGRESGRWEPPREFAGHLVRISSAGPRHRGLAQAIEETTGTSVQAKAFLLVDEEDPAHVRWTALLAVVFLGFAAANAVAIGRLVRRVS